MSLKTKATMSFAALAVAVAAAFYFYDPAPHRDRDEVLISLVVTFTPVQRSVPVDIIVAANGHVAAHDTGTESPWQESVSAPRGTVVTITAVQRSGQGYLDCTAVAHGVKHGPNPATLVPRPGTEGCLAAVTA